MKHILVLPFAAILAVISVTSRVEAFDSFYRLVADTKEIDGVAQHDDFKSDAIQHGSVQHDKARYNGADQKVGATQKCAPTQKSCATQKGEPAQKCGKSHGFNWAPLFGHAQKGCSDAKGGCEQKTGPVQCQKSCCETKGKSDAKGGGLPRVRHLQGAAVRLQCAAMNLHSNLKVHCEMLKIRLCAPLCGCGSKCDGKCGGFDKGGYVEDLDYAK